MSISTLTFNEWTRNNLFTQHLKDCLKDDISICTWIISSSSKFNSKRRVFENFSSLEAIVEEKLGELIILLGNRLSEFASFKLSLIRFFILTFKIHIVNLKNIIFVQHCLEDQVPHHVPHMHHLLWDCWIHEEDVLQQAHYLNHLSDSKATLLSQKLYFLETFKII